MTEAEQVELGVCVSASFPKMPTSWVIQGQEYGLVPVFSNYKHPRYCNCSWHFNWGITCLQCQASL